MNSCKFISVGRYYTMNCREIMKCDSVSILHLYTEVVRIVSLKFTRVTVLWDVMVHWLSR